MSPESSSEPSIEVSDSRRRHYLATFDGWRAIAAMLVIFCHLGIQGVLRHLPFAEYLDQWSWRSGSVGVDIFFCLSGFLITYLILAERESSGAFNLSRFWIRRIFRIVPLTWFYVFVVGVSSVLGLDLVSHKNLLPTCLFYYNYFDAPGSTYCWWLVHTWTLGVEMQFYLFWSLIVWMTGCRRMAFLSLGCALMIAGWRSYIGRHGVELNLWRTDFRADVLFMGAFFGSIYFHAEGKLFLKKYLPPWSLLFILAVLIFVIGWQPHGALSLRPIFFGLLITGTLVNASNGAFRWMESAPLTWLGRISFSIYIWQELFTGPGLFRSGSFLATLFALPFSVIWILPVAWLSYRYIEAPGVRLGARLIRGATKPS